MFTFRVWQSFPATGFSRATVMAPCETRVHQNCIFSIMLSCRFYLIFFVCLQRLIDWDYICCSFSQHCGLHLLVSSPWIQKFLTINFNTFFCFFFFNVTNALPLSLMFWFVVYSPYSFSCYFPFHFLLVTYEEKITNRYDLNLEYCNSA